MRINFGNDTSLPFSSTPSPLGFYVCHVSMVVAVLRLKGLARFRGG